MIIIPYTWLEQEKRHQLDRENVSLESYTEAETGSGSEAAIG